LITNAIGRTSEGGTILVSADDMGEWVQVSVADTGTSIRLEDQSGLFERFTTSGSEHDVRTGLGLAVAKETVRAHGGMIWVDSGPGPGCVFSFTLPVSRPRDEDGVTSAAMQRTTDQ
jgi:NtrC-family two-component system sensor histidine kinase KinB